MYCLIYQHPTVGMLDTVLSGNWTLGTGHSTVQPFARTAFQLLVNLTAFMYSPNSNCPTEDNLSDRFSIHYINFLHPCLMDHQLIVAALRSSEASWEYLSLEGARGSLLSSKWTKTKKVVGKVPTKHVSYVHRNDLVFVGGSEGVMSKLQNGHIYGREWNSFSMLENEGSSFDEMLYDACAVKAETDLFLVIGGKEGSTNDVQSNIVHFDMKTHTIQERRSLVFPRALHSCVTVLEKVVNGETGETSIKKRVLIAGGLTSNGQIPNDEFYDITEKTSEATSSKLNRFGHSLVTLGQTIYSIGGHEPGGASTTAVLKFNFALTSWTSHPVSLLSSNTANLALSTLPISSIEQHKICQAGVPANSKILGGDVVQVTTILIHLPQVARHPWMAALVTLSKQTLEKPLPKYSKCSGTLVSDLCQLT